MDSKHCQYIPLDGSGHVHIFRCSVFESCCGNSCCRMHGLSFNQMLYFWLFIALIFLLCSGGGFWARRRYHINSQSLPTVSSTTAVSNRNQTIARSHSSGTTVFYPIAGYNQYPACGTVIMGGTNNNTPAYSAAQNSMIVVPPPYTGPPPSYENVCKPESQQTTQQQ